MQTHERIVDMSEDSSHILEEADDLEIPEQKDYGIMKPSGYIYKGFFNLSKGEPKLNPNDTIKICLVRVVSTAIKPFLMMCLYKNENDELVWPNLEYSPTPGKQARQDLDKVFAEWDGDIVYRGYKLEGSQVTLVLEYIPTTPVTDTIEAGKLDNSWWWCIISELLNDRKVLTLTIHPSVTEYLEDHPDLLFLYDNILGKVYETPAIGYYGSYANHIAVTVVLGLQKAPPQASLGPYYYFGDYGRAMRYAVWTQNLKPLEINQKMITVNEKGQYDKGGMVRFALFLGKTTMFLNRPTDKPDTSEISREMARKDPFIGATIKLWDVDAKWVYKYNSVRQGRIQDTIFDALDRDKDGEISEDEWKFLDNYVDIFKMYDTEKKGVITKSQWRLLTNFIRGNNQAIVKEYNQQVPLSYYYVNPTNQDLTQLDNIRVE